MQDRSSHHPDGARHGAPRDDIPTFVPPIDTEEIFRRLIVDELRSGRLTGAQRRRIVRYGTGMGLSAVQMGRLLDTCRKEALQSDGDAENCHTLRLVEPRSPLIPTHVKIGLVVVGAIVIDLLLIMSLL